MKPQPIEYAAASEEVRAVFDDIRTTRNASSSRNISAMRASKPPRAAYRI